MEKHQNILERAFKAMDNAYSPYSNYCVGACVLTKDNKYFIGAIKENVVHLHNLYLKLTFTLQS